MQAKGKAVKPGKGRGKDTGKFEVSLSFATGIYVGRSLNQPQTCPCLCPARLVAAPAF